MWGRLNVFVADDVFCFGVQVGDGSTTNRNTPVSVSGLGSGIAMIALGGVRFVAIASERYVNVGAGCFGLIDCAVVMLWHEAV
jgi:hypothetical protein